MLENTFINKEDAGSCSNADLHTYTENSMERCEPRRSSTEIAKGKETDEIYTTHYEEEWLRKFNTHIMYLRQEE